MPILIWQGLGVVGLAILFGLTERALQSRRPAAGPSRLTRASVLAIAIMATVGIPFWWFGTPFIFPWVMPPLAAHLMAACGLAFGVGCTLILINGTTGALRLGCCMVGAFSMPLLVAATMLNRDELDLGAAQTWLFYAIILGSTLCSAIGLIRLPYNERGLSGVTETMIGSLVGAWAILLFLWPDGPAEAIWPWPDDPLTTRLTAGMFMTVAVVGWLAEGRAERRIALWVDLVYGCGVAAAVSHIYFTTNSGPWVYAVLWGGIAVVAAIGLLTDRAVDLEDGSSHLG